MKSFMKIVSLSLFVLTIGISGCSPKYTTEDKGDFVLIHNPEGATIGYSRSSGVQPLTVDRLGFKDLNKNGQLDKYEDWRLPVDERAKDLAEKCR